MLFISLRVGGAGRMTHPFLARLVNDSVIWSQKLRRYPSMTRHLRVPHLVRRRGALPHRWGHNLCLEVGTVDGNTPVNEFQRAERTQLLMVDGHEHIYEVDWGISEVLEILSQHGRKLERDAEKSLHPEGADVTE